MLDLLVNDMSEVVGLGATAFAWNGHNFDLPFLAQRCAANGIRMFKNLMVNYHGRWFWNEAFVDPMQVWSGHGQRHDGASLKSVAYALGLGLKEGYGKDFADLLKNDPVAAKSYAIMDCNLLRGVVRSMGI